MHWRREKSQPAARARLLASTVFPTPGHVLDHHVAAREQRDDAAPRGSPRGARTARAQASTRARRRRAAAGSSSSARSGERGEGRAHDAAEGKHAAGPPAGPGRRGRPARGPPAAARPRRGCARRRRPCSCAAAPSSPSGADDGDLVVRAAEADAVAPRRRCGRSGRGPCARAWRARALEAGRRRARPRSRPAPGAPARGREVGEDVRRSAPGRAPGAPSAALSILPVAGASAGRKSATAAAITSTSHDGKRGARPRRCRSAAVGRVDVARCPGGGAGRRWRRAR